VAFSYGWELTLVLLCSLPLMSVGGAALAQLQTSLATREMAAYGRAGAIAEEVLGGIRTVVAFGGEAGGGSLEISMNFVSFEINFAKIIF
jgi:ABC-type bacteriocin/lantibiotic exporter with double-glycine peptidase domain